MSKNDLTIIVTIRERRNTLPRIMNYYKDFPATVIFLDNTPSGIYKSADMAYPHTYCYVPEKGYIKKISDCLQEIQTKYCIIMCDDDFLTYSSVNHSINFLEQNKDYVACWGQEVSIQDNFLVAETYDYLSKFYAPSDNPLERVTNVWRYFNGGLVHSLCRTKTLRKVFDFHTENKDLDAIRYFDKTFSFCLAALGNIKCLPLCHIMRSAETGSLSLLISPDHKGSIDDWRPNLQFGKDFLNHDLTPLASLIKSDVAYIHELHKDLCNGIYQKDFHFDLMSEISTRAQDFRATPARQYKISGRTLYASYGSGANFDGERGYFDSSSLNTSPEGLYPSFYTGSHPDLEIIIKCVDNFPITGGI
tara:strand:- start:13585 stop:14670 length:1086 start_codon:yes stop_codon:yes gene_type:complete